MSGFLGPIRWLYKEFGVDSVWDTGRDAWLVILSRTSRMIAYGATSLVIALFFSALSFSDLQIGLFMTLTLFGDVLLSLLLTLVADRLGRRRVLLAGAILMIISGSVFALSENYIVLLLAAVVGVISPSGGDFGPFRAIEESTISHLTTIKTRADVLSWYVTTSSLGSAFGTEFAGRAVDYLKSGGSGWPVKSAYHALFWLYLMMGLVNVVTALTMSDKCELTEPQTEKPAYTKVGTSEVEEHNSKSHKVHDADGDDDDNSSRDSLDDLDPAPAATSNGHSTIAPLKKEPYLASISPPTRAIMYKLWFLLTVDSLADGMTTNSLTYYYMHRKLQLSTSTLGDISSISYFLASISTIFASPLARRLGLINTMVFTHMPSSLAVLLFPFPPGVFWTVTLFYIRTGLNNMDQAPRSAFIAAVVKPEERTAVMGITSLLRTLASTLGPSLTGWLAGNENFWIAFVVAGALRLAYDFGLWALFVNLKIDADMPSGNGDGPSTHADEEESIEMKNTIRGMNMSTLEGTRATPQS